MTKRLGLEETMVRSYSWDAVWLVSGTSVRAQSEAVGLPGAAAVTPGCRAALGVLHPHGGRNSPAGLAGAGCKRNRNFILWEYQQKHFRDEIENILAVSYLIRRSESQKFKD